MAKHRREIKRNQRRDPAEQRKSQKIQSVIRKLRCERFLRKLNKQGLKRRLRTFEKWRPLLEEKLAFKNLVLKERFIHMHILQKKIASLGPDREEEARKIRVNYDKCAKIFVPKTEKQIAVIEKELENCCAKIREYKSSATQRSESSDQVAIDFSSMSIGGGSGKCGRSDELAFDELAAKQNP